MRSNGYQLKQKEAGQTGALLLKLTNTCPSHRLAVPNCVPCAIDQREIDQRDRDRGVDVGNKKWREIRTKIEGTGSCSCHKILLLSSSIQPRAGSF